MKKKLNFSKAGIKQLALAHGEKAVFALGVLIFATFVYAFFGRVTLPPEKGPKPLADSADAAQKHMTDSLWDAAQANLSITDYFKRANHVALIPEGYVLKTPLDMPVKPPSNKRGEPVLLAVESVQATGGQGPFSLKVDKTETETHGQRWVMVVGLVPVKKQAAAFTETFKEAIPIAETRPTGGARRETEVVRDAPVYAKQPIVERAEVVDGNEDKLEWKPVNMRKILEMQEAWAVKTPEIVSREFFDPVYTKPLGPLVSGEWDESAVHPPEIPLATETERLAQEELDKKAQEEHDRLLKAQAEGDAADLTPDGRPPRPGATRRPNQQGGMAPDGKTKQKDVEYRLFRFIDLTVEPKKRYRYRVRLVVANPNYNLPEKFLKIAKSGEAPYLLTPPSEPSPIVEIPRGDGILVGEPKPPGKGLPPADPPATLLVYAVEPESGLKAAVERQVFRGSVLNFTTSVEILDPGTKKFVEKEVVFNTGALVLDIRGGKYFANMTRDSRIMEPCEVLLLGGDSRLEAHNELDEVDQFKKEAPKDKDDVVQAPRAQQQPAPVTTTGKNGEKRPKAGDKKGGNLLDGPVAKPAATGPKKRPAPK